MRNSRELTTWLAAAALLCGAGAAVAQPANDLCTAAEVIAATGLPLSVNAAGDLSAAGPTTAVTPAVCATSYRDVFYTFTPVASAAYTLSTCNSVTGPLDTVLSVHSACPGDGSTLITGLCNDDNCSGGAGASTINNATLDAGTTYIIRVARFGTSGAGGPFRLDITSGAFGACCDSVTGACQLRSQAACASPSTFNGAATCSPNPCPPPANDVCSGALTITAGSPAATGSNAVATAGADEIHTCQALSGRGVWFDFTATTPGTYGLTTEGSTQGDTVLSVFSACGGTSLACDDDSGTGTLSSLVVPLGAAQNVKILLSSYGTAPSGGGFTLNVNAVSAGACCNDTTGVCTITTSAACLAGSTFQGDGTVCSPIPCQPVGACCAVSGVCTTTTTAGCTGTSVFQGSGTLCLPNPCPQPIACCFANGICVFTLAANCTSAGGTADASGATSCAPSPCPGAVNNYACSSAIALPANTWRLGNNSNSTSDSAVPAATCQANSRREAWFTFTPPVTDSTYSVTTCGSTHDTVIQVFTVGTCADPASWTTVACDDDGCAGTEPTLIPLATVGSGVASLTADLTLAAGTTYFIRLTSFGTTATGGNYQIRVNAPNVTPTNSVCCRGVTCAVIAAADCTAPAGVGVRVLDASQTSCTGQASAAAGCCYADFNKSGVKDVADIFAFLSAWFANSPFSDVGGDGTGTRDVSDIFQFLSAWFAGCT